MNAMQKIVGRLIVGCVLACWLTSNIYAQTTAKAVQSVSADDMAVMLQAVEATTPVAAESVPPYGTFYSASHANWAPLPANVNSVPAWNLGDGVWLLDDLDQPQAQMQTMAGTMMAMSAPMPGVGGDGGTNNYTFNASSFVLPDYGTNLWIAQVGISLGNLVGIVSNSQPDISYEIQSLNLAELGAGWNSEGFILGSELTNWTPMNVAQGNRTNLIVRIRSWADDGSGLPIWWQLQYFGTTGVDPNALDLAGDGWSNWQKFQMGLNPNVFYIPPAPQGLTVKYNANNNTATLNWLPSPGNVTGYTVEKTYTYIWTTTVQDFPVSACTYPDNVSANQPNPLQGGTISVSYTIQAHYINGNSAVSASVPLEAPTFGGNISGGPQGTTVLTVATMPGNTTAIRLTEVDWGALNFQDYAHVYVTNFDVSISSFSNLVCYLPDVKAVGTTSGEFYWEGQAVGADGSLSANALLNLPYVDTALDDYSDSWMVTPFYDGRVQLKQNLVFQLRAAAVDASLHFNIPQTNTYDGGSLGAFTGTYHYPTNYTYAGLYQYANLSAYVDYGILDPYLPFEENCLFRNFVFTPADVDIGGNLTTGAGIDYWGQIQLLRPMAYQFQADWTPFPALLATNDTRWLFYDQSDYSGNNVYSVGLISVTTVDDDNYVLTMASNFRNWFGLPYVSANLAYENEAGTALATNILLAGGSLNSWDYAGANIYPQTAQPLFQTVEYDFWNPNPVYNPASQTWTSVPLPGDPAFSPANQSQQTYVGVGSQIQVAGYAKLAIQNGYSGVYGYLGQYFDQAYQVNTNGNITTNRTGILSPYGNFFATVPGQAALVTMPDVDTGQRGTGIVSCISVALNKSHNGGMDLSFNGPDATSANSPFIFWANQNFDRWATNQSPLAGYLYTDIEQDDQKIAFCPAAPITPTPDCNYSNVLANGYAYRAIPCTRDLEDFARLWVCGITTNLLAALPIGSTITLNWGDVGNPNSANPTIDLFQAADADGGIGYQTNETISAEQTNILQSRYVGRLGPGQSIQLNASQFANNWAGNHFIWCGVSNGAGGLTLTITDNNGNTLAQTTAYIQIVDIKQMYERWTVGDIPTNAPVAVPYLVSDNSPAGMLAFQYTWPTDTNTPYILHVHGFNLAPWIKDRFAETEFKRLYWQGYQGRFGLFRWPTTFTPYLRTFDDSESNAWASAKGLLNLLTNLNAEYPGQVYVTAHSHGAVVVGEALRQATQQGLGQIVNTYVAMQGALDSHTYDPTTPTRAVAFSTPDCYGQYYTDGAPCYFNGSAGAGTYVNFFNPNDYALSASIWQRDQNTKPDNSIVSSPPYYYYSSVAGFFRMPGFGTNSISALNFPANTYEIFAYGDQAHGYALGAQANVGGAFLTLTNYNQVELDVAPYSFGPQHIYHSGEFRSDNAQRWQFWDEVLFQMVLKSKL